MSKLISIGGAFNREIPGFAGSLTTTDLMFANLYKRAGQSPHTIKLPNMGVHDVFEMRDVVWDEICNSCAREERVSLVGHSAGGIIAANILTQHGDKVQSVYTIAAPHQGGRQLTEQILRPFASMARGVGGIDIDKFDKTFKPFLDETHAAYAEIGDDIAGRLTLIGSVWDEVVGLDSALDLQYEGAKRFIPHSSKWWVGHVAIASDCEVIEHILSNQ